MRTDAVTTVEVVARILDLLPGRPVVLDPVLRAGTGDRLTVEGLAGELVATLVPRAFETMGARVVHRFDEAVRRAERRIALSVCCSTAAP